MPNSRPPGVALPRAAAVRIDIGQWQAAAETGDDPRRMSGGLDTLETYEVAGQKLPGQDGVRRLLCSAVLGQPDSNERVRFFETVAVNPGLIGQGFRGRGAGRRVASRGIDRQRSHPQTRLNILGGFVLVEQDQSCGPTWFTSGGTESFEPDPKPGLQRVAVSE